MQRFTCLFLFAFSLGLKAAVIYPSTGGGGGGGGSATNALNQIQTNGVAVTTAVTTNLNFVGSPNITVPATNGLGVVAITPTLSSNLTGIATVTGTNGSVMQFGGLPAGTVYQYSNSASANFSMTADGLFGVSTFLLAAGTPAMPFYAGGPLAATNNTGLSAFSPWPMPYALTRVGRGVLNIIGTNTGAYWDITATNSGMVLQSYGYPQSKWLSTFLCTNGNAASIVIEAGVSNVTIQGLQINGNTNQDAIKAQNVTGCTFRDNWLHDNTGNGLLSQDSTNILVERNLAQNNGLNNTNVTHLHGLYVSGTNVTVRGNVCFDNTNGYGLQVYGNAIPSNNVNCVVYNNLFFKNSRGVTISQQAGCTNYYFNNTCVSNTSTAEQFYGTGTSTIFATNNIDQNNGNGVLSNSGGNLIEDYNVVEAAVASPGTHDVVSTAPGFVNGAAGLFWIVPNSPARGIAINQVPAVDFFGSTVTTNQDAGFSQYSPNWKANDVRTLYRSSFPDYWALQPSVALPIVVAAGASMTVTTNTSGTGTSYTLTPTPGASPSLNLINSTNLSGTNIFGGIKQDRIDGWAFWPGDTLPATTTTNTPGTGSGAIQSAGSTIHAWNISQTASNRWNIPWIIPGEWDGGTVTFSIGIQSATNSPTSNITNVWAVACAVNGTAQPAFVAITNNLPGGTGIIKTNFDVSGLIISGTPKPGDYAQFLVESRAGNTPWSSTNTELFVCAFVRYGVTNTPNYNVTWP